MFDAYLRSRYERDRPQWLPTSEFENREDPHACQVHPAAQVSFHEKTLDHGVSDFTVYNRMLMPLAFEGNEVEYKALTEDVAIWDVGAERQVELVGPDAAELAQLLTVRDLSNMQVGTCRYAIMCNDDGIVLNDPVLLKLAEDRFWFSIADSDMLLWCQAHAAVRSLNVKVYEPDVSPLAIQGPRSQDLLVDLFSIDMARLKYFHFVETELEGMPMVVARSGWSPELGYELYLQDSEYGAQLWEMVWNYGEKYGIKPGAPNQSRRVEGGMLSFGGDTWPDTNALELGLPKRFCDPFKSHEFIGKSALQRVAAKGIEWQFLGIQFDQPESLDDDAWRGEKCRLYRLDDERPAERSLEHASVGSLTVITYSPKFSTNLGLATVRTALRPGDRVVAKMASGQLYTGKMSRIPFPDVYLDEKKQDLENDYKVTCLGSVNAMTGS